MIQPSALNDVELNIYNMLGQKVRTIAEEKQAPGFYNLEFNATDLPSGIYIYKIKAGNFIDFKKMILMR